MPSHYLALLEDQINVERVPFTERGARLLVYKHPETPCLNLELAERVTISGVETWGWRVISDLCLTDEDGQALDFTLTTYPHALFFNTRLGRFGLAFEDRHTLAFGLPPGVSAGIKGTVHTDTHRATESGGSFGGKTELIYGTTGEVVRDQVEVAGKGYRFEFLVKPEGEAKITLSMGGKAPGVTARPFSKLLAQAERRWESWFERAPECDERYRQKYYYAWWVMAANLVSPEGRLKYEAMLPSKAKYIGVWNWDSAFHALAFRHVDPELARDQIRTLLSAQSPNGMLPDVVHKDGIVDWIDHPIPGPVTKPPVMAWAAWKLHQTAPDLEFLREVYEPLVRWNAWWRSEANTSAGGLPHYAHPYSSGLDDSPLWDHGMPVVSPDLCAHLHRQMASLAEIADAIGRKSEAEAWREQAQALLERAVAQLYDPQAGIFRAFHGEQPILETTLPNLAPLWIGRLPSEITAGLIAQLTDSDKFWGAYPLATVARDSDSYSPDTMWRGPVWINTNYLFVEGLELSGHEELADKLRTQTLDLVAEHEGINEYYNPDTGKAPSTAAPMFGWSAALFIELAVRKRVDDE